MNKFAYKVQFTFKTENKVMNMNPAEAFILDHIFWTKKQYEIAQQFIQSNSLLNKLLNLTSFLEKHIPQTSQAKRRQRQKQMIHQLRPVEQIVQMVYYSKIQHNKKFILQGMKKPHAIILLSGQIKIMKTGLSLQDTKFCESKNYKSNKYQKKIQESLPVSLGFFIRPNQTIIVNSDCEIIVQQNFSPDKQKKRPAQILFIPLKAYQDFLNKSSQQKSQRFSKHLMGYFQKINKKQALKLAQNCEFVELSIGNHLYKIGQIPQQVFLLIQGVIKLESISQESETYPYASNQTQFSPKKYNSTIVNAVTIVGDTDIHLIKRYNNAIVLSSSAQMISIPKKEYLKISKNPLFVLPDVPSRRQISNKFIQRKSESPKRPPRLMGLGQLRLHKIASSPEKQQLPILNSARSIPKFQQQVIQRKMFRNSHTMMQVAGSGRRKGNFSVRSPKNLLENSQQARNPYEGKFNLYQKIRPNPLKLDINHRLF